MEKKILIGFLLTLVIIVFLPLYAIGEPARQERALHRQQEQALERGAETFVALCASCHGPEGQGLIGPALKGTKLNKETLVKVVTRGRQTDRVPMPAWGPEDGGPLKKHQIDDVVFFIQNWDDHILREAAEKHEAVVHLPDEPVAAGKQIYTTVGCNFCHGGGGEGTNFAPPLGGRTRDQIVKQVRQPRTPLMPVFTPQHLSDANLEKIVTFLLALKAPPAPALPQTSSGDDAAAQGAQIFAKQGCGACHGAGGEGGVGPKLTGLLGSTAKLATGADVKVDEDYIKESITNPTAKVRAGFQPIMPPFAQLSPADLQKLVAFLGSLK